MATYDQVRHLVLWHGLGLAVSAALWSWDGGRWTLERVGDPTGDGRPTPRSQDAMAFDPTRGIALLFGGYDGTTRGDTWEWHGGAAARPGVAFLASFSASGAPADAALLSVETCWDAGGAPGGEQIGEDGTILSVWDGLEWLPVARGEAPAVSPGRLCWSTSSAELLARLQSGASRTIGLAVTPRSPNGPARSRVAIDYAELVVRYRPRLESEADCRDGRDDDLDGHADCADLGCDGAPHCDPAGEARCEDGLDNDGDARPDCADDDCEGTAACEADEETRCTDGVDNDGDGLVDCFDLDCYDHCPEGQECHPDGYCTADWVEVALGSKARGPTSAVGHNDADSTTLCARRVRPPRYPAILRGVSAYIGGAAYDVPSGGRVQPFYADRLLDWFGEDGTPVAEAAPVASVGEARADVQGQYLDFALPRRVLTRGDVLVGFGARGLYPCRANARLFEPDTAYLGQAAPVAGERAALAAQNEGQGYPPADFLIRGRFVCFPECEGRECGPDACGERCGQCPDGTTCAPLGRCQPFEEVVAGARADEPATLLSVGGRRPLTCVRRVEPPSYPATLQAVELYVPGGAQGVAPGDRVTAFYSTEGRLLYEDSGPPALYLNPVVWAEDFEVPGTERYVRVAVPEVALTRGPVFVGTTIDVPGRQASCPAELSADTTGASYGAVGVAAAAEHDLVLPAITIDVGGVPLRPMVRAVFGLPRP